MILFTVFIASFVVSSVQGSRVAYMAVRADKASYEMGENVTFTLTPLSPGAKCTLQGYSSNSGITMLRLPDDIDPETYLDDEQVLVNISMWSHGGSFPQGPYVAIPSITTNGEPLSFSWNGTISTFDPVTGNVTWGQASAGYYILCPVNFLSSGSATKLMLDRSSIFYLDGLRVAFDVTYIGGNFSVRADLSLGEGTEGIDGMFSTVVPDHTEYQEGNVTLFNETVHLVPGSTTSITIEYPGVDMGYGPPTTNLLCYLYTGERTFTFGFYQSYYSDVNPDGEQVTGVRNVQY